MEQSSLFFTVNQCPNVAICARVRTSAWRRNSWKTNY